MRHRLTVAALGIAALLTLADFAGGLATILRLLEDTRREERALAVLAQADVAGFALAGAQSRHRFYLLSGDEAVAREYAGRRADWVRELRELRDLVQDPAQVQRVAALERTGGRLFARLDEALAQRQLVPAVAELAQDAERQVAQFVEAERRILQERRELTAASALRSTWLVVLLAILAVGLFVAAGDMFRRLRLERDRALADLTQAEQRLELAVHGSELAVWDWDVVSDTVYLGETWARILGGAPGPLTTSSKELFHRIHPEDVAKVRYAVAASMSGGEDSYRVEHRVRAENGSYRWISSRGRVVARDDEGRARRIAGTNMDITERRETEHALATRERQLRDMASNVPAMIVDLDAEDRFRFCNRRYSEFFGVEADQLTGRPLREVIAADGYGRFLQEAPKVRAGEPVSYERGIERSGKPPATVEVRVVPQLDWNGAFAGCYVVLLDVTERRRLERMKDEFVANVSHELRTPLTSIRASLGLLANGSAGSLAPDVAKLIEVARASCERLVRLVNDILDFEKARRGRTMLNLAVLDAAEAARQAAGANEGYARERGVTLEVAVPAAALPVRADPDRVAQVLTNLISNAVKHTPSGGAVAIAVEPAGERVRFSVIDRGPGVPAEFRERIFQQFAQSGKDLSVARSGTGLGLAISKAIVEQMGGAIGFDSEEGSGSVFWFDLPGAPG